MYDSSDDDQPIRTRPVVTSSTRTTRNLNEALSRALANGFSGDTDMDLIVTEEELKREEEEAKGNGSSHPVAATSTDSSTASSNSANMEAAEVRTKATLEKIRAEVKGSLGPAQSRDGCSAKAESEHSGLVDPDTSTEEIERRYVTPEEFTPTFTPTLGCLFKNK